MGSVPPQEVVHLGNPIFCLLPLSMILISVHDSLTLIIKIKQKLSSQPTRLISKKNLQFECNTDMDSTTATTATTASSYENSLLFRPTCNRCSSTMDPSVDKNQRGEWWKRCKKCRDRDTARKASGKASDEAASAARKRKSERIDNSSCVKCGNALNPSTDYQDDLGQWFQKCQKCRDKNAASESRRRKAKQSHTLCIQCGDSLNPSTDRNPRGGWVQECKKCRDKRTVTAARRKIVRFDNDLCVQCGRALDPETDLDDRGQWLARCKGCRDKNNLRMARKRMEDASRSAAARLTRSTNSKCQS